MAEINTKEAEGNAEPEKKAEAEIKENENSKSGKEDRRAQKEAKKETKSLEKEVSSLKEQLDNKNKALEEKSAAFEEKEKLVSTLNDKYLRVLAEYDNYRKRTQSEKEAIYTDAVFDVINNILPIIDSLEMALNYSGDSESVIKGVSMTVTQFNECLTKLGVKEIECKKFDPKLHNAVMHIEDEQYGESEIIQVFRKGYIKGEKVLRHAMVKVAN